MPTYYLDVSDRGRIRATGEDRKRLLHAMTTNHVQQLEPGQSVYAFFLNAQGRILADAYILCFEDQLLIDVEPEVREKIYQHLDRFIIADDVTLEDVTEATREIAVEGDLPLLPGLASFQTGPHRSHVVLAAAEFDAALTVLRQSGAVLSTQGEFESLRICQGTPRYGLDIKEANLVQETGQMHAVHFSKGCYLGQEIVERVRARGHVNKRLAHFLLSLEAAPEPGAKILAGDREVGEITSAAVSNGTVYALGYARVDQLHKPESLSVLGAPVELLN